jgi:hypothetical protein
VKKLLGRTEVEDALQRLDKLTHDEAMMATAEILKISHIVNGKVTGIDDKVTGVDDKVAGIDDKATGIDDKVRLVLNGMHTSPFSFVLNIFQSFTCLDVKQAANDVDEVKRSLSSYSISTFSRCNQFHRESITTGPSQMALSARSIYQPQHCM